MSRSYSASTVLGIALTLEGAVAVALEESDVGVMGEAVEQGRQAGGIGEYGVPLGEGEVDFLDGVLVFADDDGVLVLPQEEAGFGFL